MKTKVIEIEAAGDDDWIILNPNLHGFYGAEYSDEILLNILDTLAENHELIPSLTRSQLFNEISGELSKGLLPSSAGFKLFEYLKHETDPTSLSNSGELEGYFKRRLLGTKAYDKYEQFIQSLVRPHILKLGFEGVSGEPDSVFTKRRNLVKLSCDYNLPECLEREYQLMIAAIKPEYEYFEYCNGMKTADEATYMKLLKRVVAKYTPNYYYRYFEGLTCTNNGTLLKTFLDNMEERSSINEEFILNSIEQIMPNNPKGAEIVLDMVIEKFESLINK
jgi:hypothetical protein